MVNQILSDCDPGVWQTRNELLLLKQRFARNPWSISWTNKEANRVDCAVKLTFKSSIPFCCDVMIFEALPPLLGAICLEEQLETSLDV